MSLFLPSGYKNLPSVKWRSFDVAEWYGGEEQSELDVDELGGKKERIIACLPMIASHFLLVKVNGLKKKNVCVKRSHLVLRD